MACTFPYPYMNGRLHLGHLMIIIKTDIATRYRKRKGQDVMFPFGFHCTGMPIYASAMKLQQGDLDVRKNLIGMGISEDDVDLFKDPQHWVEVFPAMALKDLQGLNLDIDFTRSFVTTSINPCYDSFIEWQFRKLHEQDKIVRDKRPCIFSLKDKQPCADHDRQTGEGVKPLLKQLYHCDGVFYLGEIDADSPVACKGSIKIMVQADVNGIITYVSGSISDELYQNMVHQDINVTTTDKFGLSGKSPMIFITNIFLPENKVVSRSGDVCIVANVEQWYLKYSDSEWKTQVRKALANMTVHDPDVRRQLQISVDNLEDWCVSREYGLGTRLPSDPKFLIDSLSDSSIYMAYYTVCHLLHTDLFGRDAANQLVPPEQIDHQFWNAVFLGTEYKGNVPSCTIAECRRQFSKYYPPALRVTGKDLIYNHLIMSIYNHIAIFGADQVCKEYLVYGHAKVNGKKMSKSTGNFVTVADAKIQYPRVDALRILLIEAGDGVEDSNIRLTEYKNVCKALDQVEAIRAKPVFHPLTLENRKVYINMLMHCYKQSQQGFETGRFRDALTFGWRKCAKVLESYYRLGVCSESDNAVYLAQVIQHITLSLITGTNSNTAVGGPKSDHVMPEWVKDYQVDEELVNLYDLLDTTHRVIRKVIGTESKSESKSAKITFNRCIEKYECYLVPVLPVGTMITYDDTALHPKRSPFKIKPIVVPM
jgi:leucyl-tRNA synthetase